MLTVCYSVKGGQGCTTVAAGIALIQPAAVLVDTLGDVPALLGSPEPSGSGVIDLLASDQPVTVAALERLRVDAGPVMFVPRGADDAANVAASRWQELGEVLAADAKAWVLDAGTGPAWPSVAVPDAHALLVVRNCYLALRRAVVSEVRPSGVVLVEDPDRALSRRDVADVLADLPFTAVSVDPAVGRAIDAGVFAARVPDGLRRELATIDV